MRARLAIASSGQRCELREVVLRDKPQALMQASPKATVPVLVLADGRVLEQSLDIMMWALRQHDPQGWLCPQREDLAAMLALIAECDEAFKPELDRYKYPQRFSHEQAAPAADRDPTGTAVDDPRRGDQAAQTQARLHRAAGAQWLNTLEARLAEHGFLFGARVSLADMAVAPFVRQYAQVDRTWFDAQAWPHLHGWLRAWLESTLFAEVMVKYLPWAPGAEPVWFGGLTHH